MKKIKCLVLAFVILSFTISAAQAVEISRREFTDTLFKIMGISEDISRDVAGLSNEEIFDFETNYLLDNYGSRSLMGMLGSEGIRLGEFSEVVYSYLLTQDVGLSAGATAFDERMMALSQLGINFSQNNAGDTMDKFSISSLFEREDSSNRTYTS